MTIYLMGKPVSGQLADRMEAASDQAKRVRQGGASPRIDTRDYRRVLDAAEDLLLIAYAQMETNGHPGADGAARWLMHVVETCRARLSERGVYLDLACAAKKGRQ